MHFEQQTHVGQIADMPFMHFSTTAYHFRLLIAALQRHGHLPEIPALFA
jgi:hypothetical protein